MIQVKALGRIPDSHLMVEDLLSQIAFAQPIVAQAFMPVLISLFIDSNVSREAPETSKIQAHNISVQISTVKTQILTKSMENVSLFEACCDALILEMNSRAQTL